MRLVSLVWAGISTVLLCQPLAAAELESPRVLLAGLEAEETYVQFYPRNLLVRIREYGLSTTLTEEADIRQLVTNLTQLVVAADYCENRFAIPGYVAGEEALFATDSPKGTAVHIECVLVTVTDMPQSMQDVYTAILKRPVMIDVARRETRLAFNAPDLDVGPHNAEQLLGRNDNDDAQLVWRTQEIFYEAVFLNRSKPSADFRSITPYVDRVPVSSPALDKDKVDALRDGLR